ncbi:transporter substrate-binding domain-containing protein [Neobacillus sp. SM06]|uniref:transporter substrate-binding domain-containing protein n=1 Tax=Neobacillus sp. SM06 TaxID=3422492 RepID=UPI003D2C5CF1
MPIKIMFVFALIASIGFSLFVPRAMAEKKMYKIAINRSLPPFSFIDEKGKLSGFSVELMRKIARENALHFTFLPMTEREAEKALHNGTVDAIGGITYSTERDRQFDFSVPYFTMSYSIIIPSQSKNSIQKITDLRNKHVVLENRTTIVADLLNMRNTNLTFATNQYSGLLTLIEGRADAFIGNKWTSSYFLKRLDKEKEFTILEEVIEPADYAIAVREGDGTFLNVINKTLTNLKAKGELNSLVDRWIMPEQNAEVIRLEQFIRILSGILIAVAAILLFIYIWNQRLKKAVYHQTNQLWHLNKSLIWQQQKIADSNAFKESILNNVDTGIVTFDLNYRLTSCNVSAIEILNLHPKENGDCDPSQLLNQLLEDYFKQPAEQEPLLVPHIYETNENGTKKVIHYRFLELYDSQEIKTGYLLSANDVTQKMKLEQKLITQEKLHALGQLVAGVAHEIRNPLTSIKTFIDLLPAKYDRPQFREMLLEHLPAEVNRLNTIVTDLVDFARPRQPIKQKCSVAELTSFFNFLKITMQKKEIVFEEQKDDNIVFFLDPQQIRQVLLNILLNAMDAVETKPIKKILVKIEKETDFEGKVVVSDSGKGISQDHLQKIFEPFYTNKERGVGLGLTLSYKLVKENNGEIVVQSEAGIGTTFTVLLPLYKGREV